MRFPVLRTQLAGRVWMIELAVFPSVRFGHDCCPRATTSRFGPPLRAAVPCGGRGRWFIACTLGTVARALGKFDPAVSTSADQAAMPSISDVSPGLSLGVTSADRPFDADEFEHDEASSRPDIAADGNFSVTEVGRHPSGVEADGN